MQVFGVVDQAGQVLVPEIEKLVERIPDNIEFRDLNVRQELGLEAVGKG
jgi:hypothetical protein